MSKLVSNINRRIDSIAATEKLRMLTTEEINCQSLLKQLADRIAEFEQPWIPVSERLPEDGVSVLLFHPHWSLEVSRYRRGGSELLAIGLSDDTATHWMPLPASPDKG